MNLFQVLFLITIFENYFCQDINHYFENVNEKYLKFNQKSAEITWKSSIDPDNTDIQTEAEIVLKENIKWQHETCNRLAALKNRQLLNGSQTRQTYLLCRGPKYSFDEAKLVLKLTDRLQKIYSNAELCLPTEKVVTDDLTEIESAILKYIKTVEDFLKIESSENDAISTSVEILKENNQVKPKNNLCLKGEEDFEEMMEFSRNEAVLKWLWVSWREVVGSPMKETYRQLVAIENRAAMRNGYSDIGASWRDEIEVPNLRIFCRRLYKRIKPLYTLLHGVVRFYLRQHYGDVVPQKGPIPAHLLGNLWSENWEPLSDLILTKDMDLNQSIKKLNWTVMHMAKRAEDFYQSFGLPAMTDTFWKKSVFTRENGHKRCHGTAADMFQKDDYRLIYCSKTTIEDFYVLHHEMGHIQYYMAYETQPPLFRQANSALHETIGDTIMIGVMAPQHLHRLGLINDSLLFEDPNKLEDSNSDLDLNNDSIEEFDKIMKINKNNHNYKIKFILNKEIDSKDSIKRIKNDYPKIYIKDIYNTDFVNENRRYVKHELKKENKFNEPSNDDDDKIFKSTDEILLLKRALNRIPQIPFSLLIDEYRWKYFKGGLRPPEVNSGFWQMALELQGISPLMERGEEFFDIGAKFHVSDNTPYIRYFISNILQYQLFDVLCRASVFGRRNSKDPLPSSIPLHRCDIYGSKTVGKLLKDIMSRGHSQHWLTILKETIGEPISTAALEKYYEPLQKLLMKLVKRHQIPIGW